MLFLGGSVALVMACGRTGLKGDLLDSSGPSADAGGGGIGGGGMGGRAGSGGQPLAGQAGMSAAGQAGMMPFACGNGVVEPGEPCDPGDRPAPPALELRQGELRAEVAPLVGSEAAHRFYRYDSASSHTGFEAVLTSRLYLYRFHIEETLNLFMHHGIDEDTTGIVQPESAVTFDIEGLPPAALVALSDEVNELFRSAPTAARAEWSFRRNTDGGVIGGLPFPGSWHLIVTPWFIAGVDAWTFHVGNVEPGLDAEETLALALATPVEIVASDEPGTCRADCTVPFCGDARLDPGEVCDDGNDADDDGCAGCRPTPL
jgi:cysteine-rich repeat protein